MVEKGDFFHRRFIQQIQLILIKHLVCARSPQGLWNITMYETEKEKKKDMELLLLIP